MSDPKSISMERLIERSSLGSKQASLARSRVPRATGEALARAAAERAKSRAEKRRSAQG